jgi:peptidoglycan hydrolase CwlO-like protein
VSLQLFRRSGFNALDASRKNDKAKEGLIKTKENRNSSVRTIENEIHTMEMEAVDLKTKIRAKQALEERIEQMKKEIHKFNAEIKVPLVLRHLLLLF